MARMFAKSLQVHIDLGGVFKIDGDIMEQVRVDPADMLGQMCEHPADYAFVAVMAVEAERQAQDAEAACKVVKAEREAHLRSEFERTNEKVTEARLKAAVETDYLYLDSVEKALTADRNKSLMTKLCSIYEHRKFSLISGMNYSRADGSGSQTTLPNTRKAG